MFKEWFRALKVEIKHTLFETWFHFVRFGGLLIIPLIYGFSYVFAFWDPFTKVDQLPVALVTQEKTQAGEKDVFGEAIGNVMKNTQEAKIGELSLDMKATHIYRDDLYNADGSFNQEKLNDFRNNEMSNYHVAFVLPNLTNDVDKIVMSFIKDKTNSLATTSEMLEKLVQTKIQLINNFKKNYLIAFGIDLGASMSGTQKMMAGAIVKALNDQVYRDHIIGDHTLNGATINISADEYNKFIGEIISVAESLKTNHFEFVRTETYMHEHAKYGYGLTPFFVSVAMWVGAMVMTFAVHRRIYDKTVGPVARYFAKWFLIVAGTTAQATILMLSLYIIGLDKLGGTHFAYMYGFALFTGIVFGTIIQAIRFIIPSRNIGIFIAIVILVLQMASAGGLFPIETQAKGYQILNDILPMGHVVRVYRELMFETRWEVVWTHIGYLCIYPVVFLAGGLYINKTSTIKWYRDHHWKLPEHVRRRKGGA